MVKAVSTKSGLAGRFDLQTAVNQLLDACTDFLRSILQHHLNPGPKPVHGSSPPAWSPLPPAPLM